MPGRPSPIVEVREDRVAVLAVEIAVDSLAVATIGLGGHVLTAVRVDRTRDWRSAQETIADVADLARPQLAEHGPDRSIVALGVAVVGVVRREDGFVPSAPNLGWTDVPLGSLVRSGLEAHSPVVVGNDADLAAIAESTWGAGVGIDDFLCLWGEVGVGAGIISRRRSLSGSSGYAGEVGHLPLNPNGIACQCGSRGCWETEVGEDALLRHAGRGTAGGGRHAVEELLDDAANGDPNALQAIETVCRWLGVGIAGLVNLLNPRRVVLGGLFAQLHPYVRVQLERELDARVMASHRAVVEVVASRLGADAPLLGAAELAFESTLVDPTRIPVSGKRSSHA